MVVWKPKESFTASLLSSSVASHWLFSPFIVLAGWSPLLPLLLLYHTLDSLWLSDLLFLSFDNFNTLYRHCQKQDKRARASRGWRQNKITNSQKKDDFSCRPPHRVIQAVDWEYLAGTVTDTDILWKPLTVAINVTWQCQTTCCYKTEPSHNRSARRECLRAAGPLWHFRSPLCFYNLLPHRKTKQFCLISESALKVAHQDNRYQLECCGASLASCLLQSPC